MALLSFFDVNEEDAASAKDEKKAQYYNRVLLILSYMALLVFCGVMWLALPVILKWYHVSQATAELTSLPPPRL